jgi:hypothetical protein
MGNFGGFDVCLIPSAPILTPRAFNLSDNEGISTNLYFFIIE